MSDTDVEQNVKEANEEQYRERRFRLVESLVRCPAIVSAPDPQWLWEKADAILAAEPQVPRTNDR